MEAKTTEIFYLVDDFVMNSTKSTVKKTRNRKLILSDSEVITIAALFYQKQYRNLKQFYLFYV